MNTSLIVVLGQIAAGPLAAYLASAALSYLAENWKKWHTFSPNVKRAVFMAVALILGSSAQFLLVNPQAREIVDNIGPIYTFIAVALSWVSSQNAYSTGRAGFYGSSVSSYAEVDKYEK